MTSLARKLTSLTGAAFDAHDLPKELGQVQISDRPDLAQFQCNGAMAAAKIAKDAPRNIAERVSENLRDHMGLAKIEIAGPGFINLSVTDNYLGEHLTEIYKSNRLGAEKAAQKSTIILDYGGPNIAKPMHVGHLRSAIIGDSLRRMCNFAGYNALGDVHMGDWGTPMGQIISELEIRHPDWPYFDENFKGDYPKESPVTMEDLEEIYPLASQACKADPERAERARLATVDLQNKRTGYWVLWEHFIDVSVRAMKANFDALGVHFDLWKGEASVHDLIAPMVEKLQDDAFAKEDNGAIVMPVEREDDNKTVPPLILYKSDGAVMYGTTDLATIVERVKDYKPSKIIYVVDQRQSLHFEQVFRAARQAGLIKDESDLIHAGFGTMNGPDGKPFKTRAGGVMKLQDLIAMAVEKAQTRLDEAALAQDASDEERTDIAHKVAIAAIKFSDLHNNRTSDYIFDLDQMTAFEGKTGPYLLYQAVRIKSLLRKAQDQGHAPGDCFEIRDEDRTLALLLCEFPDHFEVALRNYTPHVLCDYAFRLAQTFSSFYASCHILSEENDTLRASRIALCDLTQRQLGMILDLLGISIPERM